MHFLHRQTASKAGHQLEVIYDQYSAALYRLCFSILLSKEDAEDAVHEVFIKYMHHASEFDTADHEKAWLIRVAVNQSKDMIRKKKYRTTIPLEDLMEYGIDEEQSELLQEIFTLPEKYKEVFVLHYLEGYQVNELATILKLSESAVKMRLKRGRDMLKHNMRGGEQ